MAGEVKERPNIHTALDRLIGWFSPELGVKRAESRMELRSFYDAARRDRYGGNWFPAQNASPEMTDSGDRSLVRARMRDLERNGDITEGVVDAMSRNVVGTGYTLEAQVENTRGRPMDAINDRIEELWHDWCEADNCDITGDSSFSELLEMVLRRWEVDGEIFILKIVDPNSFLPLKLQLLEPDMLAEDVFQNGGNFVFGGIEFDKYMKAVAYHFRPDPTPYFKDQTIVRYTRDEVIHIKSKKRPQQGRGMPDMTASLERVRHVQEYIGNELEAARSAAAITAFVTKSSGGSGGGVGRPDSLPNGKKGPMSEDVYRGQINYLGKDAEIKFPQPGRPNVNASGFVKFLLRMIGMSRGLSYETVARDMSEVNYSSHRGGQLEDRKTFLRKQNKLVKQFCDRVYVWFIEAAVMSGELVLPKYHENMIYRKRYLKHRWSTPGWKWVDPLKEASAINLQLALGITSLSEVCGEQGKDWYEVLRQRQQEIETCQEMGVSLPWFASPDTGTDYSELMKDEDNPPKKKEANENGRQDEET